MIVSSTEVQKNFKKYLKLCTKEPIVITKNGVAVARLVSTLEDSEESAVGNIEDLIAERRLTSRYIYGGKEASYEEYLELSKDSELT